MKLFTIGPVQMYPHTLNIASRQLPYFRDSDFSAVNLRIERNIKRLMNAPNSAKTVLLTASGTGAMEATVINLFDKSDKLLVINGGSFGHRFCEICSLHEIPHESVDLNFGEILTAERLAMFDGAGFTGLLVNIHETSTGQLYSIKMLSNFCKRNDLVFVVDAISSFLADSFDFSAYSIDAAIISSQKALALSPGVSAVVLSERVIESRLPRIEPRSLYFNFKSALRNMERGQTPFTPAVGTLLEMDDMLNSIQSVDERISKSRKLADYFRSHINELPIGVPDMPLSNALTPVLLPGNAKQIYLALKEQYGLVVTPSGGELADKMLRIGHLGNLVCDDYDTLITALIALL